MSTKSFQRLSTAGLAALTVVGLLSGCAAKKKAATADAAASSTAAAASASAAQPSDTPSKVVATGGGKFCQQVANSVNNAALQAAATSGGGADSIKTTVQAYDSLKGSVLSSAPGAIKPDLVTLFGALDQFYGALAKANYDFTKIDPSTEAALETPAVKTAEQHVDDYLKNTCGIDTGADTSGDGPSAAASASAALASALAKLTASAAPAS